MEIVGEVSVKPYPWNTGIPIFSKNSATLSSNGAPPQMKHSNFPPKPSITDLNINLRTLRGANFARA